MKRILHVIDTTGPGGAETVFVELATRLRELGYESIALVRGDGWVLKKLREKQIQSHVLDARGSFNHKYLTALVALLRRERIDIVQSHLLGSNLYCAMAGLITRTPVIATFHGAVDIGKHERLKRLKIWLMNAGVSQYVAVSNSLSKDLQNSGIRPITVIYNGIDTVKYQRITSAELRQRFGLNGRNVLVGALGNIRRAKAYDVLLKAAQIVCHEHENVHFFIAGDDRGRDADRLKGLCEDLGLNRHVHFLGFLSDASKFLAELDIFTLSSSSEGFSLATIEAQAAGLPVVVTRSGGPQEIVEDGVNGVLVNPGSAHELAVALMRVIRDADLRRRLGANARSSVVERFSVEAMVERYSRVYAEL